MRNTLAKLTFSKTRKSDTQKKKAKELLADSSEFLLVVPDGSNWKYLWVVDGTERIADFQTALRQFQDVTLTEDGA